LLSYSFYFAVYTCYKRYVVPLLKAITHCTHRSRSANGPLYLFVKRCYSLIFRHIKLMGAFQNAHRSLRAIRHTLRCFFSRSKQNSPFFFVTSGDLGRDCINFVENGMDQNCLESARGVFRGEGIKIGPQTKFG